MNKTIIQASTPESISVINDKTLIECTPDYCLVDLGKYVFKLESRKLQDSRDSN
jgi:hypothetical protein